MARSTVRLIAATTLALAIPTSAIAKEADLASECKRVHAVYPNLMLASMLEGEVNCGDPDSGEFVSCNAGETPEEKAARERRLAIRLHQEAGYKVASAACDAWEADKRNTARTDTLTRAIADARATDNWRPEKAAAE